MKTSIYFHKDDYGHDAVSKLLTKIENGCFDGDKLHCQINQRQITCNAPVPIRNIHCPFQ